MTWTVTSIKRAMGGNIFTTKELAVENTVASWDFNKTKIVLNNGKDKQKNEKL